MKSVQTFKMISVNDKIFPNLNFKLNLITYYPDWKKVSDNLAININLKVTIQNEVLDETDPFKKVYKKFDIRLSYF